MHKFIWLVVLATLGIVGCSPMEHRSDLPDKLPLPVVETNLNITKKWSSATGMGTGKKDIRLLLANDKHNLYAVDYTGKLIAIDSNTGAKSWDLDLQAPVSAGPNVVDDKLIVGTNNGRIIAVDIAKRKLAWSSITTSEILAAPQIVDNIVFVNTMDGGLSALSLLDGRQLWRFTHSLPPLVLRKSSIPVVTQDLVIAGFASGKLIALHKNDGVVVWTHDVSQPKGRTDLQRMVDISADLVIKNNTVYAASYQGNIVAVSAATGHLDWERELGCYSGFVVESDHIYVASTNGDVLALDAKNGATFWMQEALKGRILSKPAAMGKFIVIADDDGFVHWLDKTSGKLVGRFQLDKEGVEATPVILHNNVVYILGSSGKLVSLEVN